MDPNHLTAITTDMGPALCPYCGSVGTGRYMADHIDAAHGDRIAAVAWGVCVGGVLVERGEYPTADLAAARAVSVFRELEATHEDEPVQILCWTK